MSHEVKFVFRGDNAQMLAALRQVQSGVSNLQSGFNALSGQFANIATGFNSAFELAAKLANKLSAPLSAALDFEKLTVQLAPFSGGIERSRELLKSLREQSIAGTASLEELAGTARTLAGVFSSTDDVERWTKALHNIAASTGGNAQSLAASFAKAKQGGRASSFLDQAGIYRQIAEAAGVSEESLRKMASSGELSFAKLEQAILKCAEGEGVFAARAEALSGTLSGTIDSLKAAALAAFSDFAEPLLQPTAAALTALFANIKHVLMTLAGTIAAVQWKPFSTAAAAAFNAISAEASIMKQRVAAASMVAANRGASSFGTFALQARAAIGTVSAACKGLRGAVVSTGVGALVVAAGEAVAWTIEKVHEWTSSAETANAKVIDETKHYQQALESVNDVFKSITNAQELMARRDELLAAADAKTYAEDAFVNAQRRREMSARLVESANARLLEIETAQARTEAEREETARRREQSLNESLDRMKAELSGAEALAEFERERLRIKLKEQALATYKDDPDKFAKAEAYVEEYLETEARLREQKQRERAAARLSQETELLAIEEARAANDAERAQMLQDELDVRRKIAELEQAGLDAATAESLAGRFVAARAAQREPSAFAGTSVPVASREPSDLFFGESVSAGVSALQERSIRAAETSARFLEMINTTVKTIAGKPAGTILS